MTELLAFGISHKTASVDIRERIALNAQSAAQLASTSIEAGNAKEAIVLSTCNRTEIYLAGEDIIALETDIFGYFAAQTGIRPTELGRTVYSHRNCAAARHLFQVTSGFDSMVLGEHEIQGQVRQAYATARDNQTSGPITNRLFEAALRAGKRVREETALGKGKASVASVAVQLAGEQIGRLREKTVVVIGAGETSERTAQALAKQGAKTVFIANRRIERARALASRCDGEVIPLEHLPETLKYADILITSTASPHPIIHAQELREVINVRSKKPLVLIDIAVPRDIEPSCAQLPGVIYYNIDDLQAVVERTLSLRAGERTQVEELLESEVHQFASWLGRLEVVPTISALHEQAEQIVAELLKQNRGRWQSASEEDLDRIEQLANSVARRILHHPTRTLRENTDFLLHGKLELVRELFGVHQPDSAQVAQGDVQEAQVDDLAAIRQLRSKSVYG